ncbi:MAG: hypothetical protein HQL13_07355 [Candidatus Omnitrophica bacterium]|nr:hypothetical protein [Candidatus Omnitrophota bacterium]
MRKALLAWDSTDMQGNYFPNLLTEEPQIVAEKLREQHLLPPRAAMSPDFLTHQKGQVEGGIDLKTAAMATSVQKDGSGVQMKIDPVMLAQIRKTGIQSLRPMIDQITLVEDIHTLL